MRMAGALDSAGRALASTVAAGGMPPSRLICGHLVLVVVLMQNWLGILHVALPVVPNVDMVVGFGTQRLRVEQACLPPLPAQIAVLE